jgi:hypothetical protein
MFEMPGRAAAPAARCRMCLRWGSLTMISPRTQGHLRNACGLALLTSGLPAGPSAHLEGLWHLSKMLCRNPRRTSCKPVAEGNTLRGIFPRRTNTWRGWWRHAAPTNGLVVVLQSSTPVAGQPPLHLSYPALRASLSSPQYLRRAAADRVLRITFLTESGFFAANSGVVRTQWP